MQKPGQYRMQINSHRHSPNDEENTLKNTRTIFCSLLLFLIGNFSGALAAEGADAGCNPPETID